jgi:protein STE50
LLLAEIEVLRRRYELRPRLIPESPEDEKTRRDSKPHSGLFRPARYLQQRIRDNQKQKSFLALAKWAVCDAKRFDEKVKRLKNLIDGLEDISKAAGITQFQPSPQNLTLPVPILAENPPPYSVEAPVEPPIQQAQPIEVEAPAAIAPVSVPDPELFEQYISLKKYAVSLETNAPLRLRAREKLLTLNDGQLKQLRADVYDELCRRRQTGTPPPFLLPMGICHTKRSQAQERISTLPWYRFAHLVSDVVFELERRFSPWENGREDASQPVIAPEELTQSFTSRNRRHGRALPYEAPPPEPPVLSELQALQHRTRYNHATSRILNGVNRTNNPFWQIPHHSQTSTTLGQTSGPISSAFHTDSFIVVRPPAFLPSSPTFKSFRVKMDDPTSKIIPTAMKKYGIDMPWHNYSLYLEYGGTERRLELDEMPLALFKNLKRKGHKPIFRLQKVPSTIGQGAAEG